MPDIAMCQDKDCPKRLSCYRYTATPSQYQPYFAEKIVDENGKCEYYIEAGEAVDENGKCEYYIEAAKTVDKKGNCEYYIETEKEK